jgi:hypothetical protein
MRESRRVRREAPPCHSPYGWVLPATGIRPMTSSGVIFNNSKAHLVVECTHLGLIRQAHLAGVGRSHGLRLEGAAGHRFAHVLARAADVSARS